MYAKTVRKDPISVVEKQWHNILQLLEMLVTERLPSKEKWKAGTRIGWQPPTDVFETEMEIVVLVDIAGMDGKDISVVTDGQVLTIQGVRPEVAPPGKKHFHKMEIQAGPFQRIISLPARVDVRSVSTSYSKGFLEVRLKKSFEETERRKVEVE